MSRLLPALFMLGVCVPDVAAQQVPFEEVIQNLRSQDPGIRLASVRLLRESRYPEAATPLAPLVVDPVDAIQLEAIAAELSLFLVSDAPARKHVALVVEVRNPALAAAAFEAGACAVWPRPVPRQLLESLLQSVDDENAKVRMEAIYAYGALARPPIQQADAQALIKALNHVDPKIRAAAAQVIGRLGVKEAGDTLVHAINDSNPPVRYAAMRAVGDLREPRGVQALTDQFTYYGKGEGAWAALDGLAGIGHPSSVPLFRERLADKDPHLRRAAAEGLGRAGDSASIPALEMAAGDDASASVRAAVAFALQKLGRNFVARLVEFFESEKVAEQVDGYLLELGAPIVPALLAHLGDPSSSIRAHVVQLLGVIGDNANIPAIEPLTRDKDPGVARLASQAIQRIRMHAE